MLGMVNRVVNYNAEQMVLVALPFFRVRLIQLGAPRVACIHLSCDVLVWKWPRGVRPTYARSDRDTLDLLDEVY